MEEDMLDKLQQVKREELESKVRLENIKMETERAELRLKLMRAKLEEDSENDKLCLKSQEIKIEHKKEKSQSTKPKSSSHSVKIETKNEDMMSLMMKFVDLHTAPDVDIDLFSGDPLEYEYFRATFSDVVESKIADPKGRLIRLLKYTSGDAKELIKNCILDKDDGCFNEAIIHLEMPRN